MVEIKIHIIVHLFILLCKK